jgi:hypothetical protein
MSYLNVGPGADICRAENEVTFLRANLFKKVKDIFVNREDFLFIERNIEIHRRHLRVQMNEVDLLNIFRKASVHELGTSN